MMAAVTPVHVLERCCGVGQPRAHASGCPPSPLPTKDHAHVNDDSAFPAFGLVGGAFPTTALSRFYLVGGHELLHDTRPRAPGHGGGTSLCALTLAV